MRAYTETLVIKNQLAEAEAQSKARPATRPPQQASQPHVL